MASKKLTDEQIFADIESMVEDSIANTSAWATKQQKWHRLRMRIKKEKTFPFRDCSNIRMPTGETKIRKLKASLVNVIFGVRPIVNVIPITSGDIEVARKIEKFLDHLIMEIIDLKPKAVIAIDQELEKGMYFFKPYWKIDINTHTEEYSIDDFDIEEIMAFFDPEVPEEEQLARLAEKLEIDTSERVIEDNQNAVEKALKDILAGKSKFNVTLKDVLYDFPDVAIASPEYVYVPTESGFDPQDCSMITHEFFQPLRTLRMNSEEKGWSAKAIKEISGLKSYTPEKLTDMEKDRREGIERLKQSGEMVKVWEVYAYYDLNGDGYEEKCVFTLAPDFGIVLRKIALPFDNGKWPFVKIFYELIDDRWFSHRGIIEMLEDIIKEIDIQHMQKIDQQTIRNTPMFVYRAGMVNPNNVQFVPNQGIPVHGMGDLRNTIDVLNANNPNVEYSYEREEQILSTKIEELIGQVDFSLQSMINKREPRTLGEVNLQVQSQQQVFSLDADLHTGAFSKLFNHIWDQWCQYGRDEYEFAYFGENGWEKIRMSKEETQGRYRITVRGNDQNTNPQIKIQKAQAVLQGVTNPVGLQSGVIGPQQIANAYKLFYQSLDVLGWEEFVNMEPQPPQQPQEPPIEKPKFADLEDGEKAQVLTAIGIKPDLDARALNKQLELEELREDKSQSANRQRKQN